MFQGLIFISLMVLSLSQPDGWKMTDRFYGFRYALVGEVPPSTEETILKYADSQGCFGWVQRNVNIGLVGEVRCAKERGSKFKDWLSSIHNNAQYLVRKLKT